MQALYGWSVSNIDLSIIANQYLAERNPKTLDLVYFKALVNNIPAKQTELDTAIAKYSNRNIEQLDHIELSILRLACYELVFCPDIPFKVIISEALELANMFASDTSYKFINSILDQIAKASRQT
jgi:N utilization substance protein B